VEAHARAARRQRGRRRCRGRGGALHGDRQSQGLCHRRRSANSGGCDATAVAAAPSAVQRAPNAAAPVVQERAQKKAGAGPAPPLDARRSGGAARTWSPA
jgi:hypothetical protein